MVKSGAVLTLCVLAFAIGLTIYLIKEIKTQLKVGHSYNFIYKDNRFAAIVNIIAYITAIWMWDATFVIYYYTKGINP